MTLLEKLNRLPPCICRLLAQRNGVLATDAELELMTGWGHSKLERISCAATWAEISVLDADTFLQACGVSWSSQRRERWRLHLALRGGFAGIRRMHHFKKPVAARKTAVAKLLKRTEKVLRNNHERSR